MESNDEVTARLLILDYRSASLSADRRALCDFAIKLTMTPGKMSKDDVVHLRDAHWTDEQIHLATQVIAYFNYINRIADGLGVDDEAWMGDADGLSRKEWLAAKQHRLD